MSTSIPSPTVQFAGPPTNRPWWQIGMIAAAVTVAATLAVYLVATILLGQELLVENPSGGAQMAIGPAQIIPFTVIPALLATLLAASLARRIRSPRRLFVGIALVLLVVSFLSPFALEASTGTRLTLELLHVVAAFGIVGTIAGRLPSDTESG